MIQSACDGYRFGRFEVWPEKGLLLRDEKRIRIEELPFQLLLVLLESPGEVVSKETLRGRLWSDRTFGELDNGLHVAAAKLREALGEKAGAAQHIETVRRRGYRFNGEVEPIFLSSPAAGSETRAGDGAAAVEREAAAEEAVAPVLPALESGTQGVRRRSIWASGVAAILLLGVVAAALFYFSRRHAHAAIGGQAVVLGGFTNHSGDDSYNGLGHVFRVKLQESPYLNLLPDQSLARLFPDPGSASLEQLLKGCASLGGKVLLTGGLRPLGSGYEVTLTARHCASGSLLTSQTVKAQSRDTVLGALDQATDQLRKSLGEPGASLERFHAPLAQATTSSLAALRAFTMGEEKRANGKEFDAIRDYKLAVDLDPKFALAYARLGTIYSNAAELTQSTAYFQKAFDLREHTTDRERLYIAAHYYSISGQIERTIEAYELWRSLYPHDASPYENLAIEYLALGKPDKAAPVARTAVQLEGESSLSQAVLARVYLETGERAQLGALCRHLRGGKSDSAMLDESCFLLAFLENDAAAVETQSRISNANAAASELLDDAAWVAMYQGKIRSARSLFARARRTALDEGFSELAATIDVDEAMLEAEFGYVQAARRLALEALRFAPDNVSIEASAALALARSGDTTLAEAKAVKAAAQAPLDTILNDAQLPSIHAAVELAKHNAAAAVAALEPARAYDACSALALAPAYFRGLAYAEMRQPGKAAAEYRSVLGHRALVPDSPYIPLAALELSKTLERTGDTAGAADARRQADEAWQHADAEFLALHKR